MGFPPMRPPCRDRLPAVHGLLEVLVHPRHCSEQLTTSTGFQQGRGFRIDFLVRTVAGQASQFLSLMPPGLRPLGDEALCSFVLVRSPDT